MDKLPVELVARIINHVPPHDLAVLQRVSKRFYAICRDNSLWRMLCYQADCNWYNYLHTLADSATPESYSGGNDMITSILNQQLGPWGGSRGLSDWGPATGDYYFARRFTHPASKSVSQWDPSYEGEEVNWYSEYVARHAPLSVQWLQEPYPRESWSGGQQKISRQTKGIGILKDSSYGGLDHVVGPLDNGSVCLWDLSRSTSASQAFRGGIAKTSSPDILFEDISHRPAAFSNGLFLEFIGVGECVSIDSFSKRAYIAVGNLLNEVDLATFQVVSQQRYTWPVFALSQETEYHAPLTIGTALGLNLYDPRSSSQPECRDYFLSKTEEAARVPPVPSRLSSPSPVDNCNFASLFQSGPLSILHPPAPNANSIIVAGHFPSILLYDRRYFPRLQGTMHSGASLCGTTTVSTSPRPYSDVNPEWQNSHTIVACGEYRGRGSLELFTLSATSESNDWSPAKGPLWRNKSVYQNRQSASRSKLLSIASHGTRLVYSDADGYIKWVERDGRTEVRRWNLNRDPSYCMRPRSPLSSPSSFSGRYQHALFGLGLDAIYNEISPFERSSSNTEEEVIRKILPTGTDDVPDNELLLWTGERIGRLRFSPKSSQWEAGDDLDLKDESNNQENSAVPSGGHVSSKRMHLAKNRQYEETVQQSLQAHRNELNWMGDFGADS